MICVRNVSRIVAQVSRYVRRHGRRSAVLAGLALALVPALATAQQPPVPMSQPAEFARVRARFESLTPAQARALGFEAEPACVSAPPGGMGFHAVNPRLMAQQVEGRLDPQNPPILLFDGNGRVVGLEWEVHNTGQPAPALFGQRIELLPGHPGFEEPHYMLHAYFKPNGQVLFATFDPTLQCPPPDVLPAVLRPLLTGGAAVPAALPRTGGAERAGSPLWPQALPMVALAGLLLSGAALRRRASRRDA
ncbi:MAG: hypothetical protein HY332_10390 [Chloroflexi bacterium]|nr:hypothetical protein [Chloroflexota bacterium]